MRKGLVKQYLLVTSVTSFAQCLELIIDSQSGPALTETRALDQRAPLHGTFCRGLERSTLGCRGYCQPEPVGPCRWVSHTASESKYWGAAVVLPAPAASPSVTSVSSDQPWSGLQSSLVRSFERETTHKTLIRLYCSGSVLFLVIVIAYCG